MTRTLLLPAAIVSPYFVTVAVLAAAILYCSFFIAVPQAHADGLTSQQVQAILSLLQSFGADQATIDQVSSVLGGSSPAPAAGSLSISTDPASPAYQVVAGGTTGVTVGVFDISTDSNPITLQKIGLKLASGSAQDLSQVYLYSGTHLLGSVTFAGNSQFATSTLLSPPILNNTLSPQITIKADINGIGTGLPAVPGDLLQINVANVQGVDQVSGDIVSASGNVGTGAGVRIFKSYPTVALVPLSSTGLSNGTNQSLLRFSIAASPSGSIGITDIGYRIAASGATVSMPLLYVYADPSFSTPVPVPGNTLGLNGVGGTGYNEQGSVRWDAQFNGGPLEISAGTTYYFEVRATISLTGSNPSVVTSLVPDTVQRAQLLTHTASNASALFTDNFIWSPNDNTTSQFSDADWTNGYALFGDVSQTRTSSGTNTAGISIAAGTQPVNTLAPQGAIVPFTNFTLTNTSSNSVTLNDFIVQRSGAADAAFHDIEISYDGGKGTSATLNGGQAKITGPFGLGAGQSKTFTISGAMADDLSSYAAQTVQLSVVAIDTGSVVSGALPVLGATQTINTTLNACHPPQTALYGYQCWGSTGNTCVVSTIECASGYHSNKQTGTGVNGCPLPLICVADTSLSSPAEPQNNSSPESSSDESNTGHQKEASGASIKSITPTCTLTAKVNTEKSSRTSESVVLTWTSTNATSASGPHPQVKGSVTVTPTKTTTYTKTFYGPGGHTTCTATVNINNSKAQPAPVEVMAEPQTQVAAATSAPGEGLYQFLSDYSDAFNDNLAAVVEAPINVSTDSLTDIFVQLGIGQ